MKITHVLNALIKGGGERVAVDLANQAVDDGHEVTVIVGWQVDPAILRNELHSNIKVFHIFNAFDVSVSTSVCEYAHTSLNPMSKTLNVSLPPLPYPRVSFSIHLLHYLHA